MRSNRTASARTSRFAVYFTTVLRGEVAEGLKAPLSKSGTRNCVSRVQISPSPRSTVAQQFGGVAEWFIAPALKTGVPGNKRVPRIRIPPPPPRCFGSLRLAVRISHFPCEDSGSNPLGSTIDLLLSATGSIGGAILRLVSPA